MRPRGDLRIIEKYLEDERRKLVIVDSLHPLTIGSRPTEKILNSGALYSPTSFWANIS